jgi:hypothetical protein
LTRLLTSIDLLLSGKFVSESVARIYRNNRKESIGIDGRNGPEYTVIKPSNEFFDVGDGGENVGNIDRVFFHNNAIKSFFTYFLTIG